MSIGVEVIFCR